MKDHFGQGSGVEAETIELMRPQQISGWVHFHAMQGQNHFRFRIGLRHSNQTKQLLQGAVMSLGMETLSHLTWTVKNKSAILGRANKVIFNQLLHKVVVFVEVTRVEA